MVVRNKVYRIIEKYRSILKSKDAKKNKSRIKSLDFYVKNGRWPSRFGKSKRERELGTRFENFVSKESLGYDPNFRRLVMATGRKTNNKRKHNVSEFKKQILEFVKTNGRVPVTHREYETFEGESLLRSRLDYYTKNKNDMTLLGKVYEVDMCHKSGVPSKYRAIINESLNISKPLIRLVPNKE